MSQNLFFSLERLWKLAVVAIASGAIVMALEIAGSRIITPVFGSTTYSWGILIGVVLSGLTIGYHLGGRVSSFSPSFGKLCSIVFSTGIFIVFIPYMSQEVIGFFTGVFSDSVTANLLVTLALFCPPSILAGFVSPYAIKLGTGSLQKVGNISGNLYSLSTLGSIFGTFFTVFVLIPFFEINHIVFGLGASLILISTIGLGKIPRIVAGLIILLLILGYAAESPVEKWGGALIEKESQYSNIRVTESNGFRTLYIDGTVHSIMNVENPDGLELYYTRLFHVANLINPNIDSVLFVGGGGFSGPKSFLAAYPGMSVDVVEIDPDVVEVAKRYFALKDDPNLTVYAEDARHYLARTAKKYDAVILDAYSGSSIPFHLLTLEYYNLLNDRLSADGVVVLNFIGTIEGRYSQLFNANYKTMLEVFPVVHTFPTNVNNVDHRQNIAVVATKAEHDIISTLSGDGCAIYQHVTCDDLLENHLIPQNTGDAPLLTDQFSPVDHLAGYFVQPPAVEQQGLGGFGVPTGDLMVKVGMGVLTVAWAFLTRQIWQKGDPAVQSQAT